MNIVCYFIAVVHIVLNASFAFTTSKSREKRSIEAVAGKNSVYGPYGPYHIFLDASFTVRPVCYI